MSLMRDLLKDMTVQIDLAELKEELSKNGIVICPMYGCNQDFKSLWGLRYHLKQGNHQATGERRFKCEQCNLLFQSRVNLRQHRITEHSGSESGSPLSSPLSSPSSKEKETIHFASLFSTIKDKTTHLNQENEDGNHSCRGVNLGREFLVDESGSRTPNEFNERARSASEKSNKSSNSGLEDRTTTHDENCDKTAGTAKRKRGRPQKTKNSENSDNTTSQTSQSAFNSFLPDQLGEISSSSQAKTKNSKKTSPSHVTARRTSTRVRTPRKNFYIDVDTAKNKSLSSSSKQRGIKRKGSKGNKSGGENETGPSKTKTPKKRGRKPKRTDSKNDNNVSIQDCDYDTNVGKTRGEKNGQGIIDGDDNVHLKKIENDVDNSEVQEENEDNGFHDDDNGDEDDDNNDNNDGDDDDENDDDDDNDDDDEIDWSHKPTKRKRKKQLEKKESNKNRTTAKKKQGRKKLPPPTEAVLLKRRLNAGQKLTCKNEGCGAKFTTALGYQLHLKTCGVKEEDREKFTCEICGKEYISMPGLVYHMKAKHIESEPVDNDHPEERNEEATEPEVTPSGRARRKAASRAMSKVQQLATDHHLVEKMSPKKDQLAKNNKTIKKAEIDQLLTTLKGREVSKEQEDRWTETLKAELNVPCPCKGCSETFTSVSSLKEHLKACEKAFSYKCLACNKVFLSQMFARNHVKHWHVGYTPAGNDMSDSSDVDFKAISSEESEEDEDGVEIEEIEDSGSDMGEDFNEADEIHVWNDRRKKYRKSKKTKKRDPAYANTGPVGEIHSVAYKATEKWRQEAHKHNELFSNLGPSVSYWSIVDSSEIGQYVPEEPMSPQFTIRRKQESRGEDMLQLPLFGSTSKDDSLVYGDVTFNAGGPVWAMDWCPVPDSRNKEEQFLAISAHRSMDQVHSIHKTICSKGLIQLWNVGKLMVNSASSGCTPNLSLGIAHNYGAIWDISWCPSGTWEPKSSNRVQSNGLSRLGVMAIACSDGLVRILSIPWPSALFHSLQTKQSDTHSPYPPVIVHATPHAVLMPCALDAAYNGQCGQAWCVKWCPRSMHEKIATGFSDGTVAIWNLLTESRLLKGSVDDGGQTFRLAPFIHIMTNSSVVRSLAWCPHNPNIFATASYDRCYKFWNLKTPYIPIITVRRGQTTELHWSVSFGTIVGCEDDCFQNANFPSIVRSFNFIGERTTTHSTVHNSAFWTVHVSDWTKLLASADAAGEVEGVYLRKKCSSKFGIYRVNLEKRNDDKSLQQKEDGTAGKQDEDISELSEERNVDISKEKNDASLPRTTKEVFQQHKLVFHDVNAIEFTQNINRSDPDVKRLLNPLSMQNIPYDSLTNPEAIHKVRFNPNKQAFTWLASGGAAGLTRLHLIKQVKET